MVTPGTNGYLAGPPTEWLEALRKLGNDAELRLKIGQSGRRLAEQMYNLHGTAPRLLELLASVQKA
jgi:glycosyltransferase involved in cell wall biosynthesis